MLLELNAYQVTDLFASCNLIYMYMYMIIYMNMYMILFSQMTICYCLWVFRDLLV